MARLWRNAGDAAVGDRAGQVFSVSADRAAARAAAESSRSGLEKTSLSTAPICSGVDTPAKRAQRCPTKCHRRCPDRTAAGRWWLVAVIARRIQTRRWQRGRHGDRRLWHGTHNARAAGGAKRESRIVGGARTAVVTAAPGCGDGHVARDIAEQAAGSGERHRQVHERCRHRLRRPRAPQCFLGPVESRALEEPAADATGCDNRRSPE